MSKVLRLGCTMGDCLSSEQLGTAQFVKTQDLRDVVAGVLFALEAEDNLALVDKSIEIPRDVQVCASHGPFDGELSKWTWQKFTYSQMLFSVCEDTR